MASSSAGAQALWLDYEQMCCTEYRRCTYPRDVPVTATFSPIPATFGMLRMKPSAVKFACFKETGQASSLLVALEVFCGSGSVPQASLPAVAMIFGESHGQS